MQEDLVLTPTEHLSLYTLVTGPAAGGLCMPRAQQ